MPSYKTQFGTFLKTEDLMGKAHRVVIERVTIENVGGEKKEDKLVAHFAGRNKALVLNKTKCEVLEKLTGTDDYSQWAGTMLVLRPGLTKYAGKTVGCIDIVGSAPQGPRRVAPPPEPEPEPEPALDGPAFEDSEGGGGAENLDDIPF